MGINFAVALGLHAVVSELLLNVFMQYYPHCKCSVEACCGIDMLCDCYVAAVHVQAGEPYRVYIVTPMYPEGVPTSGSVQAILQFQTLTRQMMYR